MSSPPALIDPFGRHVSYLRVSVTDRCDFRCNYCMAEKMEFLPHDLGHDLAQQRLVDGSLRAEQGVEAGVGVVVHDGPWSAFPDATSALVLLQDPPDDV